jgi:hypothetical protein
LGINVSLKDWLRNGWLIEHTSRLRVSKSEKVGDMSSAGRRRGFRTGFID